MTFAFHISREARERYEVDDELFTLTGNVVLADFSAGRRLAHRMNERAAPGRAADGPIHAGQLNAMGLLDEVLHAVVAQYREQVHPPAMAMALAAMVERVGPDRLQRTLEAFVAQFPTAEAMRNGTTSAGYLAATTDGIPNREVALEELLMLWLTNANPANAPFGELFDDAGLAGATPYGEVIAGLIAHFGTQPPFGPDGQTLIEMLRAPALAVPDSIAGQLRFVRERWATVIAVLGDRLVVTLDVLAEEEQGIWRRFHPSDPGGGAEEAARRAGLPWLTESGWYRSGEGEAEPERFSVDRDWMPRLVLIAKSAFVWLDQLSKRYGREISRLDAIPDEELDRLARWGFTGLWLIGLWQRSGASQTIKQLRGNPDAVASAYSLDDYRIADDLGGEEAFEHLKARAAARGLRIASDMVPNHMGVDSRWVAEHPDWFISLAQPPYPAYSFTGPDLSTDDRVGIQIEDHYFDNTDAAVVFRRLDRQTGHESYIYHGNDGTSMPWNDTAQLDYLNPAVREAVIQTILGVARRSPVIRFDAAMTLAKRHIERLWYPEPGHGGGIPSRAEHAMPKDAFERLMPIEFWREVVDRVAAEVPDTLLLAEAFWLMEGYFVRTLGMHRVYNSAFMNMLRDEQNAEYRSVIKNTIEFDPEVLKRYVNFMNNPDERTAVDQFGKGDKYFGIATLMATLPGLPMFGHGQVEGFTEKYGMEYRRAYWDEQPDPWLVERHEREIAPLLHRRHLFAEVDEFLLFDFVRDDGSIDEDVFAYSNRGGGESSLIVYNGRYGATSGRIRESAVHAARQGEGERTPTRRTLADGLGLHGGDGWFVALRDWRTGLESLRDGTEIRDQGLRLDLDGYACRVYIGIREVQDTQGRPWARLTSDLGGRSVPNLDEALRDLLLQPVQDPLRRLLEPARLQRIATAANGHGLTDLIDDVAALISATREALGEPGQPMDPDAAETLAREVADGLAAAGGMPVAEATALTRAPGAEAAVRPVAGAMPVAEATPLAPTTYGGAADRAVPGAADVTGAGAAVRSSSGATDGEGATQPPPLAEARAIARSTPPLAVTGGWLLFHNLPAALGRSSAGDRARQWIDEWRLAPVLAEAFRGSGLPEADAWRAVEAVKALLTLPAWDRTQPLADRVRAIIDAWLADESVARFLQVNVHREVRWFNKEAFEVLATWAAAIELLRDPAGAMPSELGDQAIDLWATTDALVEAAVRSGYRLDALARRPADIPAARPAPWSTPPPGP